MGKFRFTTAFLSDAQIGTLTTPAAKSLKHALDPKRRHWEIFESGYPSYWRRKEQQCANLAGPAGLSSVLQFLINLAPAIGP